MTTLTSEQQLTQFAAGLTAASLPAAVVIKVKELVLDSIGVALAGSTAPGVSAIVHPIREWGGRADSSVIGHGLRAPPPLVALANGTMATARDFDDTLDDAMLHTQPSVLYATLALAEARRCSGAEALAALAAGTELQCRMGHARLRPQQFLPTGTTGGIAAAAAAARVIGLRAERLIDACGIAYSQCAANVQPLREGATVKRFHAGFAARTGALSAVLAENGLTGAHRFLEGEFGYYRLYERGDYVAAPLTDGLGETWQLLELSLKPYPSGRDNHGAVEAALELRARHRLAAEDIERIDVWLPPNAFGVSGHPWGSLGGHPLVEALISASYSVAVALAKGRVLLDDMTPEAVSDPVVDGLAQKIHCHEITEGVDAITFVPQAVEVTARDGRRHRAEVDDYLLGHPQRPLSRERMLDKFNACLRFAARPVTAEVAQQLVDAIDHMETLPDVGLIPRLASLA
jgi:2-methylcitrate dehydratase PrpD